MRIVSFASRTHNLLGSPKNFLKLIPVLCRLENGTGILLQRTLAGFTENWVCTHCECTLEFNCALQGLIWTFGKNFQAPITKSNRNGCDHRILNHTVDAKNVKSLGAQPIQALQIEFAIRILAH